MASVTHHLPSLLSFCGVEKDGRGGGFGGIEEGEVVGNRRYGPERAKDSGIFKKYFVDFISLYVVWHAFGTFKPLVKQNLKESCM